MKYINVDCECSLYSHQLRFVLDDEYLTMDMYKQKYYMSSMDKIKTFTNYLIKGSPVYYDSTILNKESLYKIKKYIKDHFKDKDPIFIKCENCRDAVDRINLEVDISEKEKFGIVYTNYNNDYTVNTYIVIKNDNLFNRIRNILFFIFEKNKHIEICFPEKEIIRLYTILEVILRQIALQKDTK